MTSLQAETKSLLYGVQQCLLRGVSRVQVEVDSLLLVNVLPGKSRCPWLIHSDVEAIQSMLGSDWTVGHCFREANQVANILSKVGAQGLLSGMYTSHSELPRPASGAVGLDRAGIPVIRSRVVLD